MTVIGSSYLIPRNDPAALERAAQALREWDPLWDLEVPDRHSRLYEPDGTLYAICRSGAMTVVHNYREQSLSTGDLLVVPAEMPLDIEPEVDLIALRHGGSPPDHFRERFIQVWGFEHIPAPSHDHARENLTALITADDTRYPITYELLQSTAELRRGRSTALESVLALGLAGDPCEIHVGPAGQRYSVAPGDAVLVGPGLEFALRDVSRVAIVTLYDELRQYGRRQAAAARGGPSGPEFDPQARGGR